MNITNIKVECNDLGLAVCGCFTKEDLVDVNGFLMQRPKLKEEELCYKCKEYLEKWGNKCKGEKGENK